MNGGLPTHSSPKVASTFKKSQAKGSVRQSMNNNASDLDGSSVRTAFDLKMQPGSVTKLNIQEVTSQASGIKANGSQVDGVSGTAYQSRNNVNTLLKDHKSHSPVKDTKLSKKIAGDLKLQAQMSAPK